MSTTETNKLPLLIDRPLLAIKALSGTSSPVGTVDPGSGTSAVMLVDGAGTGALVETIQLIQRVSGDTTAVNLYLSPSALVLGADAFFFRQAQIAGGGDPGVTLDVGLPHLLAPVPHAGGNAAADDAIPQFQGLRLPKDWALWAAAASATPVATAPLILVTGGYY